MRVLHVEADYSEDNFSDDDALTEKVLEALEALGLTNIEVELAGEAL